MTNDMGRNEKKKEKIFTYASFQPENELFRGDMIGWQIANERRAPVLMVNIVRKMRE